MDNKQTSSKGGVGPPRNSVQIRITPCGRGGVKKGYVNDFTFSGRSPNCLQESQSLLLNGHVLAYEDGVSPIRQVLYSIFRICHRHRFIRTFASTTEASVLEAQ